jgi:hypothetical protein
LKIIYVVLAVLGLVIFSGCGESVEEKGPCVFATKRVHIIGLTSIKPDSEGKSAAGISAYISLHDSFDSSVKGPGVFRFELYEYVPRTGDIRGKQVFSWAAFDLTDATANNGYWDDFMRAYEFSLDTAIASGVLKTYILQVTCTTSGGKRLTDMFALDGKRVIRKDF